MNARRVRVTLEGIAEPAGHVPTVLRVQLDGGLVWVDTAAHGVTVEDLEATRTWTDGDVIVHNREVYVRRGGTWSTVTPNRRTLTDAMAANTLRMYPHNTEVLRYQFDEEPGPAPHTANCPDPCRHDAECPHGKAWTAGETCAVCHVQAAAPKGDPWPDLVGYGAGQ